MNLILSPSRLMTYGLSSLKISQNWADKRLACINPPAPKSKKSRTTRIEEWGLMLPQEEEEHQPYSTHKTLSDAQKPEEDLVDVSDFALSEG